MVAPRRFRALSLDLWFTTIYYDPGADRVWDAARVEVLRRVLAPPHASQYDEPELVDAMKAAHDRLGPGKELVLVPPATYVDAVAEHLQARRVVPPAEAALLYSGAGLDAAPPRIAPGAVPLVYELQARGIPVIALTNTARSAATWTEYFRTHAGPPFHEVIASCDLELGKPGPEIFQEAAHRLGLPPEEILHVGDRWELDVEGALGASFGAGLFRGLWDRYPPGLFAENNGPAGGVPGVLVLDSLSSLSEPSLWAN